MDDSVIQHSLSQAILEKRPSLSAEAEFRIFADPERLASGRTVFYTNPVRTLGSRGFTIRSLDDVSERVVWTENGRSLRRISDTIVVFAGTWSILVHPIATEAAKARERLVSGRCPVSKGVAVLAAGLLCQIDHGDLPEPPPQILVDDVLPLPFRAVDDIVERVLQAWGLNRGEGLFEATEHFLDFCKNLQYWSSTCFHVLLLKGDAAPAESFLVIAESGLTILTPESEVVMQFKLSSMKALKITPSPDGHFVVTFDFGAFHSEPVQLRTPEGPRVMECVKATVHQCLVKQRIVGSELPMSGSTAGPPVTLAVASPPTPPPGSAGLIMRHNSSGSSGGFSGSPERRASIPFGTSDSSSGTDSPGVIAPELADKALAFVNMRHRRPSLADSVGHFATANNVFAVRRASLADSFNGTH